MRGGRDRRYISYGPASYQSVDERILQSVLGRTSYFQLGRRLPRPLEELEAEKQKIVGKYSPPDKVVSSVSSRPSTPQPAEEAAQKVQQTAKSTTQDLLRRAEELGVPVTPRPFEGPTPMMRRAPLPRPAEEPSRPPTPSPPRRLPDQVTPPPPPTAYRPPDRVVKDVTGAPIAPPSPPPDVRVTVSASPSRVRVGESVTVSGKTFVGSNPNRNAQVVISYDGRQHVTSSDSNGNFSATISFGSPGTKTITVRVGPASASTTVTVEEAPRPPPPTAGPRVERIQSLIVSPPNSSVYVLLVIPSASL